MTSTRLHRFPALLLAIVFAASAASAHAQTPAKGHLVVIGGGTRPPEVMQKIAALAGGAKGRMLIFPHASGVPETGPDLEKEFRALGLGTVVLVTADRAAADTDAVLAQMDGATGVYFAGGDQNRVTAALHGTKVEQRLLALYRGRAVIAGTSAGAAVMSRGVITGDEAQLGRGSCRERG